MNERLAIGDGTLVDEFLRTREQSLAFCAPLDVEDHALQAAAFTSPPKWHLAHTTWFFETFLLKPFLRGYRSSEPLYEMLFNSYYNSIGEQFPRPQRGLLSRPNLAAVHDYRARIDAGIVSLLGGAEADNPAVRERLRLGIEHERQHQELFFTDIKYSLAVNPLLPAYQPRASLAADDAPAMHWLRYDGGLLEVGHGGGEFSFDNERPRHRCFLEPFSLASRLVTNGEYQAFIDDGGYRRPELWLAEGWTAVQEQCWDRPLYWMHRDGEDLEYTLHGLQPRAAGRPVCHLSGFEVDAFARWAGARLPTEQEWEVAASAAPAPAGGVDLGVYHPVPAPPPSPAGPTQLYGEVWQWTQSAYGPYPGYRPTEGAIGEYNGKFMSSQWVLRGGSCVSKAAHLRPSYRNFFYPPDRWQFSGLRLARSTD